MKIKLSILLLFFSIHCCCFAQQKLHVVIDGLSHDHVNRMLDKGKAGEIIITGIVEPDKLLREKKKTQWKLPDSIFFNSVETAIKKTHPDLVMVYKAPSEHLAVIETCLPLHVPVMIEKPLCYSYAEAEKIDALSKKFNTKVFTNFPTLWYTSFNALLEKAGDAGKISEIVMRGGHQGPVEIGCSKDFTNWLTDPKKNGGGALIDFGCYGALVITELMNGKLPTAVFTQTKHLKPSIYPKVDDAATILLEYKGVTGIVDASWDLPYTIMDVELFGNNASLHAAEFNQDAGPSLIYKNEKGTKPEEIPALKYKDEVAYLTAVLKNDAADDNRMMSLKYNLVVVKILDAARRSAKIGQKILMN